MAVYMIIETQVKDHELYAKYIEKAYGVIIKHGGRYIVRGGRVITFSGNWNPERVVVIEFDSVEDVKKCFQSSEYAELAPLREEAVQGQAIIVEGFSEGQDLLQQVPDRVQKGSVSVPDRVKRMNETEYFAVLATDDDGCPYTSLVAYAITPDLKNIIFTTPRGTRKYKNILNSEHVALLIDNRQKTHKNIMETEAVTATGIARPVRRGKTWELYARIFLKKHPEFDDFVRSATTAIIAVDVAQYVHVGRFQTVTLWDCR